MEREATQELEFSRVLSVRAAPAASAEELMRTACERAQDPSIFEKYPPFFLFGEISSSRWDAYDTRMGRSTLENFARDAASGVAVLRNHDTYQEPFGHSLTGRFTGAQGDGVAKVESDFYVLALPDAESSVDRLRAGLMRDLSVGFYGGEWICSLCNRDMMQWFGPKACRHMLGVYYTPSDEAGTAKGEPQKARASIENSNLAEYSTCYDGATPGATLKKKARFLDSEGLLDSRTRELIQVRYKIELPGPQRIFPGADLRGGRGEESDMSENGNRTPPAPGEGVQVNGRVLVLADIERQDARMADLVTLLDGAQIAAGQENPVERVRWMTGELARLRQVETEATELRPLAADGRTYRADLVEEALREGVRAHGDKFDRATYEEMLKGSSLAVVKRMRDDWKTVGDAALKGGRKTADGGEEPPAATPKPGLPARAFAA